MTLHVASTLSDGTEIPVPIGMPTLVKMAFDGMDLAPCGIRWSDAIRGHAMARCFRLTERDDKLMREEGVTVSQAAAPA
jgi:hypothetical protein